MSRKNHVQEIDSQASSVLIESRPYGATAIIELKIQPLAVDVSLINDACYVLAIARIILPELTLRPSRHFESGVHQRSP
jgi:hypothetical protein